MNNKRLDYFDSIKGVMIIMVIYLHILINCVFENVIYIPSWIVETTSKFHMPMFFFITGFFAYNVYDWDKFRTKLVKRFISQVWPAFLIYLLYCFYSPESPISQAFDNFKNGYWFTYSLFQVLLLFTLILVTFSFLNIKKKNQILILFLLSIIFFPLHYLISKYYPKVFTSDLSLFLSLTKSVDLVPFLFLGALVKALYEPLECFIQKTKNYIFRNIRIAKWALIACLTLFFFKLSFLWTPFLLRIAQICMVLIILILFMITGNYWSGKSIIALHLSIILPAHETVG